MTDRATSDDQWPPAKAVGGSLPPGQALGGGPPSGSESFTLDHVPNFRSEFCKITIRGYGVAGNRLV